ncbi:uncharacterized protein GLRG_07922 [Colletotrichum graminicola M1.001]|uniref:Uncharacterized protein n=1 Tax=Colletotrichum graminicola (strain M1.001 / M2 / FGSC 10212) TaxID=645133 RepID=E3QPJ0_COLGM|nr:uncharacterized protein GLRG_07922 [Colletotrichum graminicola M1.001]EFQ32778.1 hypothetical protein GLRG_07922 [Colletotrichum graminicola M1.001]
MSHKPYTPPSPPTRVDIPPVQPSSAAATSPSSSLSSTRSLGSLPFPAGAAAWLMAVFSDHAHIVPPSCSSASLRCSPKLRVPEHGKGGRKPVPREEARPPRTLRLAEANSSGEGPARWTVGAGLAVCEVARGQRNFILK